MNNELQITFLGTGTSQGIPVIGSTHPVCLSSDLRDKRLRSSVLVSWADCTYVIDCGPDFRQQMLIHEVDTIDGILFTHEHSDHTAGLDDIRPFYFRQGDIPIYASDDVIKSLIKRYDYIFADENRYPGAPALKVHKITSTSNLSLKHKKVTVIKAWHNRLKVYGFRIDDFTYLTDVKYIEPNEMEKILGSKVLVINALRIEPHHSHLNLDEAIAFVKEAKPKVAYFTHISHMLGFHEIVEKELPKNIHLAYDGLIIKI